MSWRKIQKLFKGRKATILAAILLLSLVSVPAAHAALLIRKISGEMPVFGDVDDFKISPDERYVVFRVHSQEKLDYSTMQNAAWNSMLNWMGEKELSKANVHFIKNLWDAGKQTGFVQCSPKYVDSVKIGLGLVHQIGDQRVIFQTIRVSGTIKSGKNKAGLNKSKPNKK